MAKQITFILSLFISINAFSQSSFLVSHGANKSITIEYKEVNRGNQIIYGAGISYFYNKGNIGKDYTGFTNNLGYSQVVANEGALFFCIGNKINKSLSCNFRFGFGNVVRFINGKGINAMPDVLWYTRNKFSVDIVTGLSLQYNADHLAITAGWDNFNSFNIGVGFNFNKKL